MTDDSFQTARKLYVEELTVLARISSPALIEAFATVPRERFVGPGPWHIHGPTGDWSTRETDPRQIYRDVLISLDASKRINNGQPSLWASHLDQLCVGRNDHVLHLGCGTGYYTAILAELVGPEGKVTAIEIDAAIADRARIALSLWPQVTVIHADGSIGPFEPVDDLVVSAGATHPPASWLAAIKPGGKLLFPLTPERDAGVMAHLVRVNTNTFKARLVYGVDFIPFHGARSPVASRQLAQALNRDRGESVRSLRCDAHPTDNTCWLHGDGWCFSMRDPAPG